MKTLSAGTALLLTLAAMAHGQSCETLIQEGRAFLVQSNLPAANTRFAQAIASCPTHQTGHVFYAVTRLAVLPSLPAGSNFLSRLGFTNEGRDIYAWTAPLPQDTNGSVVLPADFNGTEVVGQLRTNILPQISGALTNLARVTDTNFVLTMTSNETKLAEVTLDYADIQMLRALLHVAEYQAYTLNSWNLNLANAVLHDLATNSPFSVERLLQQYPHLLEFATLDERLLARAAFTNAVARYLVASELIRNRPLETVRLFNPDPDIAKAEGGFRELLADLVRSLDGPVVLRANPNFTVNLAPHFAGSASVRSLLPEFAGGAVRAGSVPDPTFGGVVMGYSRGDIEELLSRKFALVPWFGTPIRILTGEVFTRLFAPIGRSFAVLATDQLSSRWADWSVVDYVLGSAEGTWLAGPPVAAYPRLFLAAMEAGSPVNDRFADRVGLVGSTVVAWGSTLGATLEPGEPNYSYYPGWPSWQPQTVWWTWTASASGYVRCSTTRGQLSLFTGATLETLTPLLTNYVRAGTTLQLRVANSDPWNTPGVFKLTLELLPPPPNDNFASAQLVTGSSAMLQGRIFGGTMEAGERQHGVLPGAPPILLTSSEWWSWTAPTSGRYLVRKLYGSDIRFAVYAGGTLATLVPVVTNNVRGVAFDASAGTRYSIVVAGLSGDTAETGLTLERVAVPPNDNFADRTLLTGVALTVSASNLGATREPGSDSSMPYSTANSTLWWTWTAPTSGVLLVSTEFTDFRTQLGLFSGNTPATLTMLGGHGSWEDYYSRVAVPVTAGQQIQIVVGEIDGKRGLIVLHLSLQPRIPNDGFANRVVLVGALVTTNGTTLGATAEPGEPAHGYQPAAHSVWWSWTAPASSTYWFSMETGKDAEFVMVIYTGTNLSSLTRVTSSWYYPDYAPGLPLSATAGTTYALAVDSPSRPGAFTLRITP